MDELWQRYRAFWLPVLYGVGAFLAGLIVVHIATPDPEAGQSQNVARVRTISGFTAPTPAQIKGARDNAETLKKETLRKAPLLDQRHGDGEDSIEVFVRQTLVATVLRGSDPALVDRFDGDAGARDQAQARFAALVSERTNQLKTQDPNVAFSRLRADAEQELSIRANRADVDVGSGAEEFGQQAVQSVERSELPRRLANLALIATVLDVAIREGVRSIDGVAILAPETYGAVAGSEPFLSEWPVKIDLTGTPDALTGVLNVLTDPTRPTPIGTCSWKQLADRSTSSSRAERRAREGIVRAELKVYSVRVRPEVGLGLESEGD